MMADAMDELMLVVRTVGREELPADRLSTMLLGFFSRLWYLHGRDEGVRRSGSYTEFVIGVLESHTSTWVGRADRVYPAVVISLVV